MVVSKSIVLPCFRGLTDVFGRAYSRVAMKKYINQNLVCVFNGNHIALQFSVYFLHSSKEFGHII